MANSEYRHEFESDIDPFKGLLLGLFFIAVGASIDFNRFKYLASIRNEEEYVTAVQNNTVEFEATIRADQEFWGTKASNGWETEGIKEV